MSGGKLHRFHAPQEAYDVMRPAPRVRQLLRRQLSATASNHQLLCMGSFSIFCWAVIPHPSLRHDRAAHCGGAERDEEGTEQEEDRDARSAIGEDEIAQMRGIDQQEPADEQRRGAGAGGEVDGEQAEEGHAQQREALWLVVGGHG
jgi:hypothetical protein